MAHMELEVFKGDGWAIETDDGTVYAPDIDASDAEAYRKAIGTGQRVTVGDVYGRVEAVTHLVGWWGRYSAPGYLDATPWLFSKNKRELLKELRDFYGENPGAARKRNPDPTRKKMTLAQAREIARGYQTTLRKNVHGEFVVTPLWDRREESRYYASDLDDALATAKDMYERFTSSARRPVMVARQQRYVKNARSRRQAKRNASAYVKNPKRPPRGSKLRFLSDAGKAAAERITIVREGGYVHQVKYEDVNDDRAYVHDFDDLSAFMYLVETVWGRGVLIVPADDKPLWENS